VERDEVKIEDVPQIEDGESAALIVCCRATSKPPTPSVRGACNRCGCDVWLARSSQKLLAINLHIAVECIECFVANHKPGSLVPRRAPGSDAEVIAALGGVN
jgi:hypothetical protein